ESIETLEKLIQAGMNVARLNFSHGDYAGPRERIKNIRTAANNMGQAVAVVLDTKGPEVRTGTFRHGEASLKKGNRVHVTVRDVEGTAERFSVTYDGWMNDVYTGAKMLLDDGLIELEVLAIDHETQEIKTKALNTGIIKDKKGINVP